MYKSVSVIQVQKIQETVREKYDLNVPTYKVSLPNGNFQVYDHDELSIADVNTSQEDKDSWEAYTAMQNEMMSEINEKTSAYIFYEGVDCEIDDDWLAMQEWLGIEIPDNKFDRKVRYITTEVLKTPQDIKQAIIEIMKLSTKGVDKSAIKAAEGTFQDSI